MTSISNIIIVDIAFASGIMGGGLLNTKVPYSNFMLVILVKLVLKVTIIIHTEFEFNEFELRLKSAKDRIQLSAGLNLETTNMILSGTIHN